MFEKISKTIKTDELLFHKIGMVLGMIIGVIVGLIVSSEADHYVIEEVPSEIEKPE